METIYENTKEDEECNDYWKFEEILDHKTNSKGRIQLLMKWKGFDEPSWELLNIIREDDPEAVFNYAKRKGLLNNPKWKWAKRRSERIKEKKNTQSKIMATKRKKRGPKFKFGHKVPKTIQECYELDKENRNDDWVKAIDK